MMEIIEKKVVLRVPEIIILDFDLKENVDLSSFRGNIEIVFNCLIYFENKKELPVNFSAVFFSDSVSNFVGIFGERIEAVKEKFILYAWFRIEDEIRRQLNLINTHNLSEFDKILFYNIDREIQSKESIIMLIQDFDLNNLSVEVKVEVLENFKNIDYNNLFH